MEACRGAQHLSLSRPTRTAWTGRLPGGELHRPAPVAPSRVVVLRRLRVAWARSRPAVSCEVKALEGLQPGHTAALLHGPTMVLALASNSEEVGGGGGGEGPRCSLTHYCPAAWLVLPLEARV